MQSVIIVISGLAVSIIYFVIPCATGGQSYIDTANNNKLCPSLAKFNFIQVFVLC